MSIFSHERVCAGCGCTDEDACADPVTGLPCSWVEGLNFDVCTVCQAVADALPADEPESRIGIYTPAEAQHFINATRDARLAVGL